MLLLLQLFYLVIRHNQNTKILTFFCLFLLYIKVIKKLSIYIQGFQHNNHKIQFFHQHSRLIYPMIICKPMIELFF